MTELVTATKIISARLPMAEYIKFLTDATDLRLSVSEYFYLKIYQEDKSTKLSLELDKINKQANDSAKTISSLQASKSALEKELSSTIQFANQQIEKSKNLMQSEISKNQKLKLECKNILVKLTDYNKTNFFESKALDEIIRDLNKCI